MQTKKNHQTKKGANQVIDLIGLYTPINYFGRYATCSPKMADAQCSVSGNHWPGGPRDMLTTTSVRVNSSPAS